MNFKRLLLAATVACAPLASHAGLTLNAAGVADGFNLTTFVDPYPAGGGYGPLSQAVLGNGNIITGSSFDGNIYIFNDTNGQTLGSALSAIHYSCETGNCNWAMATAGGQAYGGQAFGGIFYRFNNDGSRVAIGGAIARDGIRAFLGMWGGPNGHLIASSNIGLLDIDPTTGNYRVVNGGVFPDGITVSPDGSTVYIENNGTIQAIRLSDGAVQNTYFPGHSPDGTGVIIGGVFDGDIIVNDNDGTLGLLDTHTGTFTIIADGGSRGDFVSVDTNNGTLFISQNEQVLRLSCGPGCSIGVPTDPNGTPEPGSLALIGLALVAGWGARRRV
jgi:WD40 repeat protein